MRTQAIIMLAAAALAVGSAACGEDREPGGTLQAFCEADATVGSTDPFGAADATEAERLTEQMRDAFAEGRRAAPDDIAADAKRISAVFEGMLDDLEAAGYDTGRVDPGALFAAAAASDPEFEPALERVGRYTEEKCGQ